LGIGRYHRPGRHRKGKKYANAYYKVETARKRHRNTSSCAVALFAAEVSA
jgi:hypothetical protein